MKNHYTFLMNRLTSYYWKVNRATLAPYIEATERAMSFSNLREATLKNISKSIRYTGMASARGQRLLIDEGIVRKLQTMLVQSGGKVDRPALSELIKDTLKYYPWDKCAIFVDSEMETFMARQEARMHVLTGSSRTPESQKSAAETVFRLCSEMGWKTLRIWNGKGDPPPMAFIPTSVEKASS